MILYAEWPNIITWIAVVGGILFLLLFTYIGWKFWKVLDSPFLRRGK